MKRIANFVGALLMVGGVALLGYVGVAYERGASSTHASPNWNAAQRQKGRQIAAELSRAQAVVVPNHVRRAAVAPGSEPATRIVIPRINVDAPVIETPAVNGAWEVGNWAVGHLTSTPNPGAAGNDAISAHDDIEGEIFKRLGELSPGDSVRLYTRHATYTYVVTSEITVDPSNVGVLAPTKHPTLTMISCVPYWVDTQRLIVKAVLKSRTVV